MSEGILVIVSVVLGASVVLLASLLGRGRQRKRREGGDDRIGELAARLDARLDEFARDLEDVLGQAEEERRWRPFLDDIGQSVDLDEVLERTLETARRLPGASAASITLDTRHGPPVVATSGLPGDSFELPVFAPKYGASVGRELREIRVSFLYSDSAEDGTPDPTVIRSALAVPLADDAGRLGYLSIYGHVAPDSFGPDGLQRLQELAQRAAPAIENARQFREARQLADLDALTGMHNRRYFYEALEREVLRARRYDRSLSLMVIDLDDFKLVNDRIGHLAGDEVLAIASERILRVVRGADIACRIGGDEFAVILPESGLVEAQQLFRRIEDAVAEGPIGRTDRIGVSAGMAELRAGDGPTGLFDVADEALYRAKQSGKGRSIIARPI